MHPRTPLVCAALAALAAPAAEQELAWQPEEGSLVLRSFREQTDWGLTAMDQDSDLPEISGTTLRELEVSDEIEALGEGQPALLRRTFESARRTSEIDFEFLDVSDSYAFSLETELEDATVSFEWNGDDEEWLVACDEVDDDLLVGLREDLDLRALLPEGEASEGDSWQQGGENSYRVEMTVGLDINTLLTAEASSK